MKARALHLIPLLALISAACTSAERAGTGGDVTVDTLAGGIIAVTSAAPTAWTDSSGWRLVADGALEGEVGSPGELVNPRTWTVDERGYVYVADARPEVIKVYDERGRFVRSFGREGSGPGEFRVALIFARDGHVLVHDPSASRVSLFDTSGTYTRSWIGACCYWYQPFIDTHARLFIPTEPPDGASRAFLRYDTLGTLLDTVLAPKVASAEKWTFREGKNMVMSSDVPFMPKGQLGFMPDGRMVHGWSGQFRLAVGSGRGRDTTRLFGRAWEPERVSGDRIDATYDDVTARLAKSMEIDAVAIRQQFEKARIPGTLPAYTGVSIDALGNTWVHLDDDSTRTRFDVFDPAGVYLGPVAVPAQVRSFSSAWGRDVMYVRQDSDEGYPRIVRYRIERRP